MTEVFYFNKTKKEKFKNKKDKKKGKLFYQTHLDVF